MARLVVPHHPQTADGYCLPACLQMVLSFYGIERTQSDIARQLGVIEGVGVPASRVARLASRSLSVSRRQADWPDVVQALAAGIPPIMQVRTGELPYWTEDVYHVILVSGIAGEADNTVTIHDPAFDAPVTANAGDVMLAWDAMDNYLILAHPAP